MKKTFFAMTLLILFTYSVEGSTEVNAKTFRCDMSVIGQKLSRGVYLKFTVTNLTNHKLRLLSWYTPLEGFLSDLFIIKNETDESLDYNGIMVKRNNPSHDDYLVLSSEESVDVTLDLTQAYPLVQGEYTVQLASKSWSYIQDQIPLTSLCSSDSLKIKVS